MFHGFIVFYWMYCEYLGNIDNDMTELDCFIINLYLFVAY